MSLQTSPSSPAKWFSIRRLASTDYLMIVAVFLSSRLMMLMAFPPENLITYGDYNYYFTVAGLSRDGIYPFINYWSEYPPLFIYLNIAIFWLSEPHIQHYIILMALVLLLVECTNLYLIYRLAGLLHGPAQAVQISWVYVGLFVPVFFWLGNFDALTTLFILLALYSLLFNKTRLLNIALGLGAMVKFVPVIMLAAVWRAWGFRAAIVSGVGTLLVVALILGPFFIASPDFTVASLRAQASKSSHQTIWALLDNNHHTGFLGPQIDHLDPAKATVPLHNPSRIPTWLTLIPFGLLGLFSLQKSRPLTDKNLDAIQFAGLTLILFFLWVQGWSPQWQTYLIPLLLLALPLKRAVFFIIVLGFINFLEWPIMIIRGYNDYLSFTILLRTMLFIIIGLELYQRLFTRDKALVSAAGF